MHLFIGCPIWSFRGWVGNFYPPGTRPADYLREYTRRLTTVEGNTTFYAVPSDKTLTQWVDEMPLTFRFCAKVPRDISHAGALMPHIAAARRFVETMSALGPRLGPMFLQLPPAYSPRRMDDLTAFLDAWPTEARLAVEVRHLDWFDPPHHAALNNLLAARGMARVVIDTRPIRTLAGDKMLSGSVYESLLEARQRKPDVPVLPETTTDFVFVRYIGHPRLEVNAPFLEEWGNFLAASCRAGADAFVFCHTPDNLLAPDLCRALHGRVSGQVSLPPLPWDEADAGILTQGRLF